MIRNIKNSMSCKQFYRFFTHQCKKQIMCIKIAYRDRLRKVT